VLARCRIATHFSWDNCVDVGTTSWMAVSVRPGIANVAWPLVLGNITVAPTGN